MNPYSSRLTVDGEICASIPGLIRLPVDELTKTTGCRVADSGSTTASTSPIRT